MALMGRQFIKETFSDSVFIRKLFHLALPIAFQNFMLACVAASDTIMLGMLEQNAMAAVSLASQIQFVQNVTVSGVVAALQILGAQYAGRGDKKTLDKIFCMSFRISVIISAIFAYLCFFTPAPLMRIFTNQDILVTLGVDYLKVAAVSYLITGISQPLISLIKLGENTPAVAKISTTAVVLNIALNGIFIFGLFGFPALGIEGAALATVISRIVELILSLYYAYKDSFTRPDFTRLFYFNKELSKDFVKQLMPLMGAYVFWTIGFASYSAFMGHISLDAAAANSVASVVRNLVSCFMRGLAGGAAILVGYDLGAGNLQRAKVYGDRLTFLSVVCGAISCALILLSIMPALKIVHLSAGAEKDFITIASILSLYIIGAAFNSVVINGMFASGGDTLFDFYSIMITMWCIAIPIAALGTFVFSWPVAIVYGCTCLDEVGKIPWTFYHYRKYKWLKDLTRDQE